MTRIVRRDAGSGAIGEAREILGRLAALSESTEEIRLQARQSANPLLELKAIARLEKQLELLARLTGELQVHHSVTRVSVSADFAQLRDVLLRALQPFPEAREVAAQALLAAGTDNGERESD